MIRIQLINPNTSAGMTEAIGQCARTVAAPGTVIDAVNPAMGPATIESHYDEALAVPGLLQAISHGMEQGAQGHIIACFGDPGLYAARERATGPVLGIAEAAMHMASMLGNRFAVVTTLKRTCHMAWMLAERYGMQRFCANVRGTDIPVAALERPSAALYQQLYDECRAAISQDGADVIILGCAGMAPLAQALARDLGVPVIDGVIAAVKQLEALIALGWNTSKQGDFALPATKPYTGRLADFALTAQNS